MRYVMYTCHPQNLFSSLQTFDLSTSMSNKLKKHAKTLKFLSETDHATAKAIVKTARPDLVNCFTEICYNVLNGNVNLSPSYKRKLTKHKKTIRAIAKKNTKASTKRNHLQKGGFLSLILPLVRTLLPSLLGGLFGGKK